MPQLASELAWLEPCKNMDELVMTIGEEAETRRPPRRLKKEKTDEFHLASLGSKMLEKKERGKEKRGNSRVFTRHKPSIAIPGCLMG